MSRVGPGSLVIAGLLLGAPLTVSALPAQETVSEQVAQGRALFVEALALARDGDLAAARDKALAGVELAPEDADGLNLLAEIQAGLGELESAVTTYERAIAADPEWVAPREGLGRLHLVREAWEPAVEVLSGAVRMQPDDPRLRVQLAIAHRGAGDPRAALAEFERAWELDSGSGALAADVAAARAATGDVGGAIAAARRATELAPDDPTAWTLYGQALLTRRSIDDVLRLSAAYRRAAELRPDDPDGWIRLGTAYSEIGLTADAERAYRRAIELGADSAQLHSALGRELSRQSQFEDAVEALGAALERDPTLGEALFLRGEALFNLNRMDEALADVVAAVEAIPDDPSPLLTGVRIYMFKGQFDQAAAYIQRADELGGAEAQVDLARGRLYLRQGRTAEAIAALERARTADPEEIESEYLLGQALVRAGRAEEGRSLLAEYQTKLAEEHREVVEGLRTGMAGRAGSHLMRGRVYGNEGRYAEAIEQLEAAVVLAPDLRDAWQLLAELYERTGDAQGLQRARTRLQELTSGSAPAP